MAKISVLLICQNSENTIKRTLDSCREFDEVVVVDGGSTDKTKEIVESYSNTKFIHNPWPGFIAQRNFSIEQASHDWCFMIDSDEACTPELVKELHRIVDTNPEKVLYRVMRTEFFLGEAIEHGYGKSNYQERLLKKGRVTYGGGVHHYHLIDGEHVVGDHHLVDELEPGFRVLHDDEYNVDEYLKKLPRFSILIAREKIKSGKTTNGFLVFIAFVGTFFQILWKSRKEGRRGFVIAILEGIYRTCVKLYIYQNQHFSEKELKHEQVKDLG
jgi:glycosyltransferase involved in cell wall biosynthesis